MTPEEARQLNPGDRVFIEAKVEKDDSGRTIFVNENLLISFDGGMGRTKFVTLVNPYCVSKSPRRKFKAGDIVRLDNTILAAIEDEDHFGVLVSEIDNNDKGALVEAHRLKLVCAAEAREDRKEVKHEKIATSF